jgi:hypothetical protein
MSQIYPKKLLRRLVITICIFSCGCASDNWQQVQQIRKHPEAFDTVARIHRQLLERAQQQPERNWILLKQIREEISPEEKSIILVSHRKGQLTVLDWFMALHDIRPPDRPHDLNTVEGVERFLDKYMLINNRVFQRRVAAYPWIRTKMIDTIDAYQKFIEEHPNSMYLQLAKKRLEYLQSQSD